MAMQDFRMYPNTCTLSTVRPNSSALLQTRAYLVIPLDTSVVNPLSYFGFGGGLTLASIDRATSVLSVSAAVRVCRLEVDVVISDRPES